MVGVGVYAGVKRLPPVGLIWFWVGGAVVALVVVVVVVVVGVVVLDGLLLPAPPQAAVSAPIATIATAPKTAAQRLVMMFVFTGRLISSICRDVFVADHYLRGGRVLGTPAA